MLNVLLVFLGGGLGAALRYLTSLATCAALRPWTHNDEGMPHEDALIGLLPLATLGVNVIGCLAIGLVMPSLAGQKEAWRVLLIIGILGGYTTFSAFGHETLTLYQGDRPWLAAGFVVASVGLGLGAVAIGHALAGRLGA